MSAKKGEESVHCMCQHRQMTLFNRILSFHRSRMPLNRFHFGDVSFCLKTPSHNATHLGIFLIPISKRFEMTVICLKLTQSKKYLNFGNLLKSQVFRNLYNKI